MKDSKYYSKNFFYRSRYIIIVGIVFLLLLIIVIPLAITFVSQKLQPATPSSNATPTITAGAPTAKEVEASILNNIQQNGFDSNPAINRGLGSLWINWRFGTQPMQVNFLGNGQSVTANTAMTSNTAPEHDPLTDLRYLHNLWLNKHQNPSDTKYDSEITKFTQIVKLEYANTHDTRGWLYDEEFIDLYALTNDSFFKAQALNLVRSYSRAIDPNVGIMYKKSSAHPQGFYTVDLVLQSGLDLIQAGTQFGNPTWIKPGQRIVDFMYAHAYISRYHSFASTMDQVLLPDGSVNPSETFYSDRYRNYTIRGNAMRMDGTSQIIISLLHTYQVTHNQNFLLKAEDLLDPLSLPSNTLGMWDTSNLGYYKAVTFKGTSAQQPGNIIVAQGGKEAGRQVSMLWAFHLPNQFTGNKYQNMESQLLNVALSKAYYAPGHGVLYEVNANWTPRQFTDGTMANNVTAEAMGIELESLFSLNR